MSDVKPKRAARNSPRDDGFEAEPSAPAEIAPAAATETATAAVALRTAEAAESPPGAPEAANPTPARDDPWTVWAESQTALARGFAAIAAETGAMSRSGIAAASDAAKAMLGVKTLAEAIEINAGFARRSFDAMIGGAAKLSEIGVKAATEASRPILGRLAESWEGLRAR
jgi:phasin family protein